MSTSAERLSSLLGLGIEALLCLLLFAAVFYCVRLDRRLAALRSGHDGFRESIAALDLSTTRAENALRDLKVSGLGAGEALAAERQRAEAVLDELKLMVQSADRLADRLAAAAPSSATAPKEQKSPSAGTPREAGLIEALRQAR